MKTVVIYRSDLLPISETFVQEQASAVKGYNIGYVGLRRIKSSLLLSEPTIVLTRGDGKLSSLLAKLYRCTRSAPSFHEKIAKMKPALLHAHFAPDGNVARHLATRLDIPLVVTLHGYDVNVRADFRRLYTDLWRDASLFLCVSKFIRDRAIQEGFPKDKLRVHYIGVNCSKFGVLPIKRDERLILFVGRLTEKKGCTYLLHAMERVQRVRPDAHLVIVGEGYLRTSLEISVKFLGSQSSTIVREYLAQAFCLCAPSVTATNGDSEGIPIIILEALACGLPVVSSYHAGIPEVVQSGRTGMLAPERDYNSLAEHILSLMNDRALWSSCSRSGAELVRAEFSIDSQTKLLEGIYDEVDRKWVRR